jgi:FtsP/CotA-like multicopper oxidase with cupredoxin domain
MNSPEHLSRRSFLQFASLGTAALLADAVPAVHPFTQPTARRNISGSDINASLVPDLEMVLRAGPSEASLFQRQPTRVWAYRGEVLTGDPASLQTLPNSYIGPIIRARKGQNVRINFINDLPEESIIHWHGLHVSPEMDAHPRYAVGPGQTYVYDFQVTNRAGTYWFHPHPDARTGPQVYNGLAGLLCVSDDEEDALGLPSGDYDVPLVIQDRAFDSRNQLVYARSGIMGMDGFLGDRIMVNGRPNFSLSVATQAYRLRLLNGSNSRIYKLAWSDGTPMIVIATDGGLLEAPVQRNYVMLAPGERVELLADFSRRKVGKRIKLVSQQIPGLDGGMMGGGMMGGGTGLPNGAAFNVLEVRVTRREAESFTMPSRLSTVARYRLEDAVNTNNPRTFAISSSMMRWLLNGRTFEMEAVAPNEIVQLGALEAWELVNQPASGGMMGGLTMSHPIHIHGLQFQVAGRQVLPQFASSWEAVRQGYVDEGWKDTVMLMPGERTKLLLKFEDYTGLYVYHCHNLEHEDMGMMRNYLVRP